MKILHLDSSIQGENSASRRISAEIVKNLLGHHPDAQVTHRDLAAEPLRHLTLAEFAAPESQTALAEFQAADIIVIGTGMYNFTVPSQLKAWIDRIAIAGQTFRYTPTGVEGLSGGKRVVIGVARGGYYADGTPAAFLEHAATYLRGVFTFLGITEIEVITADGMAIPDARAVGIESATQSAASLAA